MFTAILLFCSFNILLNESADFDGGGTYFDYPLNSTFHIEQVNPKIVID